MLMLCDMLSDEDRTFGLVVDAEHRTEREEGGHQRFHTHAEHYHFPPVTTLAGRNALEVGSTS
jgi:hypothetical protein